MPDTSGFVRISRQHTGPSQALVGITSEIVAFLVAEDVETGGAPTPYGMGNAPAALIPSGPRRAWELRDAALQQLEADSSRIPGPAPTDFVTTVTTNQETTDDLSAAGRQCQSLHSHRSP